MTRLCSGCRRSRRIRSKEHSGLLAKLKAKGFHKAAERHERCGEDYALICEGCGDQKMTARSCDLPFCEDCARKRSAEVAGRWTRSAQKHERDYRGDRSRPWLAPAMGWKLLTLTLVVGVSLAEDWARILVCWKKFRRLLESEVVEAHRQRLIARGVPKGAARRRAARYRRWLKQWLGGMASREIGAGRNVHLHSLSFMPYVSQERLAELWREATGDSCIVDIRAVKGGLEGGAREVAKYITKLASRSADDLVEIYEATKGTAQGRPWGALHGKVETAQLAKERRSQPCENCGVTAWVPLEVFELDNKRAMGP